MNAASVSLRLPTIVAIATVLAGPAASPVGAQFGAIRDATRRAADEAKKAEEAKKSAEEARKKAEEAKKTGSDTTAKKESTASEPSTNTGTTTASSGTSAAPAANAFEVYSKFDFVPGEKIVAMEDFTQDAIGDFPDKWDTNAAGEVVTLGGKAGRWLKLARAGFFRPEFITELPENFTFEFDLAVPPTFSGGFALNTAIVQLTDPKSSADWQTAANAFIVTARPESSDGVSDTMARQEGTNGSSNQTRTPQLGASRGTPTHIAIWRQRQRVRVYMNQEKVWDVPRAASASAKFNGVFFFVPGGCGDCEYYVANLRVATGAPDTRNKILTEGKWVSHGILFDVNSDRLKGDSYGSLKDIAGVLSENADVKVQIVGHTDADGDEAANLDLSKRRAAAVKNALVGEFKIDASRLETDGKGESQPIDKNDSPAGKANNRRVEFIKR